MLIGLRIEIVSQKQTLIEAADRAPRVAHRLDGGVDQLGANWVPLCQRGRAPDEGEKFGERSHRQRDRGSEVYLV